MAAPNPELRYAFLEDTWVIFAVTRGARPRDYAAASEPLNGPEGCPFEPGHEDHTPPEVFALREPGSPANAPGWRVRVVPNKYPALVPHVSPPIHNEGFHRREPGFGFHEVIVETTEHSHHPRTWDQETWRAVLWTWRERLRQLMRVPGVQYVQLFKNHGREAGASRAHPHTQVLALPAVPQAVERRMAQMRRYFHQHRGCYLCDEMAWERRQGLRMVYENSAFTVYCPFASRMAFEMRILPRHHQGDFTELEDEGLLALGDALQVALQALDRVLGDAAFNLLLHTLPVQNPAKAEGDEDPNRYAHWYLEILPRTGVLAGFEMATGWYINSVPPESAAAALRGEAKRN